MALTAGTKLGPYEIHSSLGAGGMGEVYRARDSRLERDVAIKVLPASLASDPSLKQRLEREAKAVSKLSHPNICTLHDIGHQDGVVFLVMELLEGETLEQRLNRGPLPSEQTMRYGAQIADALAKAHKLGFTHRDLKPANIMLTKSGAKLMDFGLAKQSAPAPFASALNEITVEQAKLTSDGMLVGTFQYMAPEQLEGKEADARTDIFALGEVLYEMATGKPAFTGKNRASLIASILTTEPPSISQLQPLIPPALERVVKKCLAKDPDDRWQSASDLASELAWIQEGDSHARVQPEAAWPHRKREYLGWVVATLALAGLLWSLLKRPHQAQPAYATRLSIVMPQDLYVSPFYAAISPDATRIAFIAASQQGKPQIWIRPLSSLLPQPLAGTDDASLPFWSPDSRQIAFFADGKLRRISADGGSVTTLADAPSGRGGAWGSSGVIIFAPDYNEVLYRVSAGGGLATRLTSFANVPGDSHRWPSFLPDGKHFLFLARGRGYGDAQGSKQKDNDPGIYVGSLDSADSKFLLHASRRAIFAYPNYLLYMQGANLMVRRFDTKRWLVSGEPTIVAESLQQDDIFGAPVSAADNGTLLYATATNSSGAALSWYSRMGKLADTVGVAPFNNIRLSPDSSRLAASMLDEESGTLQIWMYDLRRKTSSRFTFDPVDHDDPVWSPDGQSVAFESVLGSSRQILRKRTDGSQAEESLWKDRGIVYLSSWSHDGKYIAYDKVEKGQQDIWILPLSGDRKPFPYITSDAIEHFADFSPDGKWVAYASNASGKEQVYLATFPEPHARFQVSVSGGSFPQWREDGKELFYFDPENNITAVPIVLHPGTVELGSPHVLFHVNGVSGGYRVVAKNKGEQFLVAHYPSLSSSLTLVADWDQEVRK
jgi:eukaryotic-like serine/threonine-protein kinase